MRTSEAATLLQREVPTGRRVHAAVASLLFLVLGVLSGCGSTPTASAIVTAAKVQAGAAQAYATASAEENAAVGACVLRAKASGVAIVPTDPAAVVATCAGLGAPLPYDPVKLAKLAGPINGLFDAVHLADTLRKSGGDVVGALGEITGYLIALARDLDLIKAKAPPGLADDARAAAGATAKARGGK